MTVLDKTYLIKEVEKMTEERAKMTLLRVINSANTSVQLGVVARSILNLTIVSHKNIHTAGGRSIKLDALRKLRFSPFLYDAENVFAVFNSFDYAPTSDEIINGLWILTSNPYYSKVDNLSRAKVFVGYVLSMGGLKQKVSKHSPTNSSQRLWFNEAKLSTEQMGLNYLGSIKEAGLIV